MIIKMSEARPHSFLVVDRGLWNCYNIIAQVGEAITLRWVWGLP